VKKRKAEIWMMKTELESRTRKFSVALVRAVEQFPKSTAAQVLARQLLWAGTSIGANYREANRAESRNDFAHKVAIAEKEASETCYWLEVCEEAGVGPRDAVKAALKEANELLAILITIGKKVKSR
jgi:four helix bundle protein